MFLLWSYHTLLKNHCWGMHTKTINRQFHFSVMHFFFFHSGMVRCRMNEENAFPLGNAGVYAPFITFSLGLSPIPNYTTHKQFTSLNFFFINVHCFVTLSNLLLSMYILGFANTYLSFLFIYSFGVTFPFYYPDSHFEFIIFVVK